jgi:hypothetical protein
VTATTAAFVRFAGFGIRRDGARAQRRKPLSKLIIVEHCRADAELLQADMLDIGPLGIAARHPQDAVVLENGLGPTQTGVGRPVFVRADAVARQPQHFIHGVAVSADRGRRAGRTLARAGTLLQHRDLQITPACQLPGDAETDDAGTGDNDVESFFP